MTTLYRPVLIKSAEQAEALPEGVVLIRDEHYAFQKDKGRFVSADPHDLPVAHAWEAIGWTALVPIEADEETTEEIQVYLGVAHIGPRSVTAAPSRSLVTPWEEAAS